MIAAVMETTSQSVVHKVHFNELIIPTKTAKSKKVCLLDDIYYNFRNTVTEN